MCGAHARSETCCEVCSIAYITIRWTRT
jgi:hypothetical protein